MKLRRYGSALHNRFRHGNGQGTVPPPVTSLRPRRVSVVIPARNEEHLIRTCIDSVLAQDYPGDLEVIVVDNGSSDRTAEHAYRSGVRVVGEPRPGYVVALMAGFREASGDIVATTDADTVVPANWISRIAWEYENNPDVVAVGGAIHFHDPNWRGWLFTRLLLPVLTRLDATSPAGAHLWGANFSVRRDVFQSAGGWSTDFNLQADTELSERLRRYGRVVRVEDLRVSSSCRRWNHSLLHSMFLYASNFVWFRITRRPLWHEFPEIRELRNLIPAGRPRRRFTVRTGAIAAVGLILLGLVGYVACTPWSSAFGKTYWQTADTGRVLALTFDDGPNGPYTNEVLDILQREQVRATFFLIGENVRLYPDVAARIAREGHAIGNHSDTHPFAFGLDPVPLLRAQLDRAEETIHSATGIYPRLFRPPQGIRSPWLMETLKRDSLVTVTWDDAPRDWLHYPASRLVESTVRRARPGAIILLHDGLNLDHPADRSATVSALPKIIHRLRAEGYSFVTIPELLGCESSLADWPVAAPKRAGSTGGRGGGRR